MARPIPKAILFQTSDSLGISHHFSDRLHAPMFDGAKKCSEMNSDLPPSDHVSAKFRTRTSCIRRRFAAIFGSEISLDQGI
jgi:hypothetical protein